jgi:hypothetical protein
MVEEVPSHDLFDLQLLGSGCHPTGEVNMRVYLERFGVTLRNPHITHDYTAESIEDQITQVVEIYHECLKDIALQTVAYGCAVSTLSLVFDVPLKTATLIFEQALAQRSPRMT